jgi:purine-binding chemotaxis protein CheW
MPVGEKTISTPHKVTIVTFRLGSQVYALPIEPVRQIIEMVTITPLPQVSLNVAGVINFHGTIAPVINLRCYLGLVETPLKLHTPIILVTVSERLVGLIVDQVLGVVELTADQIIDPRIILTKDMGAAPILNGLIQSQEETILLLNIDQLLKFQHTSALLEATDKLAYSMKPGSSAEDVVSRPAEAPLQAQSPENAVQNESETPPTKKPKPRSRKKAGDSPIIADEVAA